MTPSRHPDPCVALIKFYHGGKTAVTEFKNEASFIAFCDVEKPVWATLCDQATGQVVVQVSYPV